LGFWVIVIPVPDTYTIIVHVIHRCAVVQSAFSETVARYRRTRYTERSALSTTVDFISLPIVSVVSLFGQNSTRTIPYSANLTVLSALRYAHAFIHYANAAIFLMTTDYL